MINIPWGNRLEKPVETYGATHSENELFRLGEYMRDDEGQMTRYNRICLKMGYSHKWGIAIKSLFCFGKI